MSGEQTLEHGNPGKHSMFSGCLWFADLPPDLSQIERALPRDAMIVNQSETPEGSGALRVTCGDVDLVVGCASALDPVVVPSNLFGLDSEEIEQTAVVTVVPDSAGDSGGDPVETVRAVSMVLLRLCALDGCVAVGWAPAESAMARDYFRSVVGKWIEGGPFPALGLTALKQHGEGGLASVGLAEIRGQELVIEPESGLSTAESARIALRVIDDVVTNGPVKVASMVEIDGFGRFEIGPDDNGKIIYLRKTPDR